MGTSFPSITIDPGTVRLLINDDKERVISFNPKDINFVERFYRLVGHLETKVQEYELKYADLVRESDVTTGIANNMPELIDLVLEVCKDLRGEIDLVFGEGTSQIAFGDTMNPDMFSQLIDGLIPYVQDTRTQIVQRYMPPPKPVIIKKSKRVRSKSK